MTSGLDFQLTECQKNMLSDLSEFIINTSEDSIYIIKGYAGTGKTTMINQLVKTLETFRIGTVLLAPTGRAAKVLMTYTGKPSFTIHKKIYRQKSSTVGSGIFVLDKNLHRNCYFIVDEASMISNQSSENSVFGSGRVLGVRRSFRADSGGGRLHRQP